ncbi:putative gibberellin 20- protein [Phaeoacremonium minimum UCRPA7]|uniref:Putative gibberellin 20-protein n=1 Tax=Phaeoacremonium minimum (strain UCR-PA7) TaxID=1286976 RepID=R8BEY7_PHAM7|nr:putative gibberellin 20- protein [Phaeoacremonium minimum UCRPA7]EON97866.1 putative gibberellin 20- protein [Phaeoacremonium minimum UCRPA7]
MASKPPVPAISLKDFEARKEQITKELVEAAETAGFFTLVDHGITIEEIESQFALSRKFFDLPQEIKARIPHDIRTNNGWEYKMRMIHYMASENAVGTWRAGNHTDIGCLTLLFQRDGEDGLEICPGRESHNDFAIGDTFTPLPAETGPIVVNIGDMLMAWSDDRLKANFHRVRAKDIGKSPDRYSIAYFNTGRKNVVMQGPLKK